MDFLYALTTAHSPVGRRVAGTHLLTKEFFPKEVTNPWSLYMSMAYQAITVTGVGSQGVIAESI